MEIKLSGSKDKQINVRITPDDYEILKDLAEQNNVSIQEVVREIISEAIISGLVVKKP